MTTKDDTVSRDVNHPDEVPQLLLVHSRLAGAELEASVWGQEKCFQDQVPVPDGVVLGLQVMGSRRGLSWGRLC